MTNAKITCIEIFDSRQRKNPFVESRENFHIDTARHDSGDSRKDIAMKAKKAKKTAKKKVAKKKKK
jgi:hypothetical protein